MTLKYDNLLLKPFQLGSQDCFKLTIDFFKQNFDIDIPSIARPADWNPDKLDLISQFYPLSGFKKLDVEENWPPRPADVLVTTIGGRNPSHLVIYVGENKIVHHKQHQFSSEEIMRPIWKKVTSYILRHPDVPDLTPQKPTIHLQDLLNDRFI